MSLDVNRGAGLRLRRPSRDHSSDLTPVLSPASPVPTAMEEAGSNSFVMDQGSSSSPFCNESFSAGIDMSDSRRPASASTQISKTMEDTTATRTPAATHMLTANTAHAAHALHGSLTPPDSVRLGPSNGILKKPSLTSPVTRDRGYSLRRTLFARNVNASGNNSIELSETADPSTLQPQGMLVQPQYGRTAPPKKSMTSVQITPASEIGVVPEVDPIDNKTAGLYTLRNYDTWARKQRGGLVLKLVEQWTVAKKRIFESQGLPPSKDGRHIDLDVGRIDPFIDGRTSREYVSNSIRSSRYTPWNFLPRQIIFQFGKIANFYFLIISILQMIPGLSTTGSYTTIIPLMIFISISMAKEGYDDLRRHKLDKAENNLSTEILRVEQSEDGVNYDRNDGTKPHSWEEIKWHDIKVGDVVKLERDEAVPADIVLLHADGLNGIAYIETMALDGETNLKAKQAPSALAEKCASLNGLIHCKAHIVVEDPNLDLYNFDGRVTVDGSTLPLTSNEVVYRGSVVRNTSHAIGMVINTGEECKIRMNANKNPRIKSPHIQVSVNRVVLVVVFFVLCLAAFMTIAYQVWDSRTESKAWYLKHAHVAAGPIWTSFIIMFNTMIPLSLYVSMEIIKLGQLALMNDISMYDPVSDTPMEAHTSTINEELGQITHIFSDKTGTLTDNVMRFRKLSVAGTAWLHDFDLQKDAEDVAVQPEPLPHKRKGKNVIRKSGVQDEPIYPAVHSIDGTIGRSSSFSSSHITRWRSTARPAKGQFELGTQELLQYLQRKPHGVFARKCRFFLLSLALCHTCLPEIQKDGSIDFQAASPDELALVRAAQDLGFMVIDRAAQTITLKSHPNGPHSPEIVETYGILDVIEFSSKRKRMSIIVRFPDGRRCIFCKGADSVIMKRLKYAPLALQKVAEVERRASARKSLEAESALRRISEAGSPKASMERTARSLRRSLGGVRSISLNRNESPARDHLDSWLRHRERDVDLASVDNPKAYMSPRTSQDPRRSTVSAELSADEADYYNDMVDEAIAVDEAAVFERCFQHIDDFATEGLRTLLYGYKFLDEHEYLNWKKIYHDASTSLVDRQELVEKAGEMIEQNLELAGATAIEDKLQKGVPETIDKLRRANIKIWMLTGDKRETAINIGHSCRLIKDYSNIVILDHEAGNVEQVMATSLLDIRQGDIAHSVLVVDGQTLSDIESNGTLALIFFDLAMVADSVIICRSSPSQKSWAVNQVRTKVKGAITLAIGDGANDIGMIQSANVGIGISSGQEGSQAARVSDYSIAKFRFLQRLLLVHGRWNYERSVVYCLGTFWKETMFYMVQALFQHSSGFSGTSLFESASLSMFNTLFTSLPVIAIGIFLQSLHASTLEAVPELYATVRTFNIKVYLYWMILAVSEAAIIYGFSCGIYGLGHLYNIDLFAMGDLAFTCCIIIIATKLLVLKLHNKTYVSLVCWVLSVGGWALWNILLAAIYPSKSSTEYAVKGAFFNRFGRELAWWLVLILTVSACLGLELVVTSMQKSFWPTDVDIFQELERDPVISKRFRDAAEGLQDEDQEHAEDGIQEVDVQKILDNRDAAFLSVVEAGKGPRASLDTLGPRRAVARGAGHNI